ncbi:aldose 1-epimerase [Stenotrophomonas rhizophila]|uniref:aldose 1-epimerase n=1 Tax=Stenotrophomonas rhizophila TaxID=216778 RepID=UPI0011A7C43A|nr:aldose epimerase [Stenotrophomonas rhizophila]
MAPEATSPKDDALAPLPAGRLYWLRAGALEVALAPEAGGRIAQIRYDGVDWLVGVDDGDSAAIAWGCYPMVPWAGRIRHGRFAFDGTPYALPTNFGGHAIHGLGFTRRWEIDALAADSASLSLALPEDETWPFGGVATQRVQLTPGQLQLHLAVQAGQQAMPTVLGWHPWFRKPDRLLFTPDAMYPQDGEGIATLPLVAPTPGPWDDCFLQHHEVTLESAGQRLRLRADTDHWVIYDAAPHATCVEPQTGPPDAFTLAPTRLEPNQPLQLTFTLSWNPTPPGGDVFADSARTASAAAAVCHVGRAAR